MTPGRCRIRRSGFTLIELVMILLIVGLVFGISLPQLKPFWNRAALEEAARNAAQVLRYAQYRAVADRGPVVLIVDPEENHYQLMKPKKEAGPLRLAPIEGDFGRPVKLERSVHFDPRSENITYFPDGSSSGGILIFKREPLLARITVKPGLGRLEVSFEGAPA